MILSFELSMPGVSSWNGRWSGEGRNYVKVVNMGRTQKAEIKAREILAKGYYHYSFGDGWAAGVSVTQVDAREAARLRRKSDGFCGYEWMVKNIIRWGTPYCQHEFERDPRSGQPHQEGEWERCIHCQMSKKKKNEAATVEPSRHACSCFKPRTPNTEEE